MVRAKLWQSLHTVVLCYLISIRLVPVEVVLSIPSTFMLYITAQCYCCSERGQQGCHLELRLRTWESCIEQSNFGVCSCILLPSQSGSTREELTRRIQLGMDLDAHCELPFVQPRICLDLFDARQLRFGLLPLGFIFQVFSEGDGWLRCRSQRCDAQVSTRLQPLRDKAGSWSAWYTSCCCSRGQQRRCTCGTEVHVRAKSEYNDMELRKVKIHRARALGCGPSRRDAYLRYLIIKV